MYVYSDVHVGMYGCDCVPEQTNNKNPKGENRTGNSKQDERNTREKDERRRRVNKRDRGKERSKNLQK